jgi:transposase
MSERKKYKNIKIGDEIFNDINDVIKKYNVSRQSVYKWISNGDATCELNDLVTIKKINGEHLPDSNQLLKEITNLKKSNDELKQLMEKLLLKLNIKSDDLISI